MHWINRSHHRTPSPLSSLTQGVDLFKKAFLFIPIHEALHWSLAVVVNPGLHGDMPCIILHIDSMDGGCGTGGEGGAGGHASSSQCA